MDVQGLSDKLDKLQTDTTAALAGIQGAVTDLKTALAAAVAQGTGTPVDLQPLADKVDAIDQAVTAAAASLAPPPA